RFAEINSAYEILGDATKRRAFDNGEIDAQGKQRFHGFAAGSAPSGFSRAGGFETFTFGPEGLRRSGARGRGGGASAGGFEDVLREMVGGAAAGRHGGFGARFEPEGFAAESGGDVAAALTISLEEAAGGTRQRVRLPTGKDVDVSIPAGLADGQQIRLRGQGLPGPSGIGDVLITVTIAAHKLFARDGNDLRLDLPVTLYEAVLGAKVRVPTLAGAVELAIPPASNSGRTLRIRGKGMPGKDRAGDLLVTLRIVLPERKDADLEALMRRWRDENPYDPRGEAG
ncbi:MAG: J domain-containing protein, partial [Proteobacteria bacterium]|nr:J domain-containing protein [Pseudomonadota bacterium]